VRDLCDVPNHQRAERHGSWIWEIPVTSSPVSLSNYSRVESLAIHQGSQGRQFAGGLLTPECSSWPGNSSCACLIAVKLVVR